MRIISANISGINAAKRAGFFAWPHIAEADILCIQETQADDVDQIGRDLGYHVASSDRRPRANGKMSHGGVAIFSRAALANVRRGGPAHLDRGQFIACSVGSFVVASVYVTLDASRSQFDAFTECFSDLLSSSQGVIVAGDFNTFRGPQDSWRFHEAVSRQEVGTDHFAREWLEGLFTSGWIDAVKYHHKVRPFHTWWHSEGHFGRKQGTRLDYIFVSPTLTSSVLPDSVAIYSEQRRGGHAQLALSIE